MAGQDKNEEEDRMGDNTAKTDGYYYGTQPPDSVVRGHAARTAAVNCQYMLPTLHELAAEKKKDKLKAATGTLKLLDAGCGPGSITLDFARLVRPDGGRVVGIDFEGSVLERARAAAAEQDVDNVEFVQADVFALPFDDASFDLVHTHQALSHFHDPVLALRELLRVLVPGGAVCVREAILPSVTISPSSPVLDEMWVLLRTTIKASGPDDCGARVLGWMLDAGLPRENVTASFGTFSYASPDDVKQWGTMWAERCTQSSMAKKGLEAGLVSHERLEEYAEAWRVWASDPKAQFGLLQGQCVARKP